VHDWVSGLSWQDDDIIHALSEGRRVNDSFVEEFRDCLPNFTLGAKLYVIPRYFSFVLRYPDRDSTDYLIYELERIVRDRAFCEALTSDQARALIFSLDLLKRKIRNTGSSDIAAKISFVSECLREMA
jgi:hypothetical protein